MCVIWRESGLRNDGRCVCGGRDEAEWTTSGRGTGAGGVLREGAQSSQESRRQGCSEFGVEGPEEAGGGGVQAHQEGWWVLGS